MLRGLIVLCASAVLLGAACGDGGDDGGDDDATSTPEVTATAELARTPVEEALLDEVIELAVELKTMTEAEAACVFEDHPSIYQEFLRTSGLDQSGTVDTGTLTQQFEDLEREYAVELSGCFRGAPSG